MTGFDLGRLLPWRRRRPVVAVLRLAGVIGSGSVGRGGLSLKSMAEPLARAFATRRVRAVALAINSPGGAAVQSALIFRRIRAMAEEKKLPVYAFIEDVGASGGYMLACAGDEIFADASSIVGSIGVVSAGFGFQDAMRRLGIERRIHAEGERKGMLDPFQAERPDDVARLKAIQKDAHAAFADLVRLRRGDRLKAGEDSLFDGGVVSGRQAVALGLIDGLGDLRDVMRERFGDTVRFVQVATEPRYPWPFSRLVAAPAGADAMAASWIAAIEARAAWARYGL